MNKNMKTIIIVGLIGVVAALSVGYAALSETLTMTGSGTVQQSTWGVAFSEGSCAITSGSPTAGTLELSGSGSNLTATISGVQLKLPGDVVTCTAKVNNPSGNVDAVLTGFTATETVSPTFSGVSVDVKYDGCDAFASCSTTNKAMTAGTTKNLVVTFTFDSSATTVPSEAITISAGANLTYGQA